MLTPQQYRLILVDPGFVSLEDFTAATGDAKATGRPLDDILVDRDLISDEQLGQLVANFYEVPFVNLHQQAVDRRAYESIPEVMSRAKGILGFALDAEGLKVGMLDPSDKDTVRLVEKKLGQKVHIYAMTRRAFADALTQFEEGIDAAYAHLKSQFDNPDLPAEERDKATVELVNVLVEHGYRNRASDVHVEPMDDRIVVRFRVDGVMHAVLQMPKEFMDPIVTRIKVLARMRTDEHRASQDGKFQFPVAGENIDVRVSIVPVTHGENVVMRLLSSRSRRFSVRDLGFSEAHMEQLQNGMMHPHGMLLVTGPTGSGKTTTVYAMLKILNKPDVHIASIEDPVEYDLEGVSQIQVNAKTNLTFAEGLRAIVRQDPDIILVGEIRDEDTASIAVNSAMTGHLVLSTVHANDAATTLPRFLEMGVEPFLVASTVRMVIAQRLVRKICEHCRESHELTEAEEASIIDDHRLTESFHLLGKDTFKGLTVFRGKGCAVCHKSGYNGRIGIFEMMELTEPIKEGIMKRVSAGEIARLARSGGMRTMLDDGIEKVMSGLTTLDEVLRVIRE